MIDKQQTLIILGKGKEYEDRLSADLIEYFLASLGGIADLTDREKEKIKRTVSHIARESIEHAVKFNEMIDYVLKNDRDNF